MRRVVTALSATFIRGALFLVPFVLMLLVLREALRVVSQLASPITQRFGIERLIGLAIVDLLAVAALAALCLAAGVIALTGPGARLVRRLERVTLLGVPGYSLLKGVARGHLGVDDPSRVQPCLARIEDAWCPAFLMERNPDDSLTVFVPSAPTPAAGTIYFMTPDRVRILDVSIREMVTCVMELGIGSARLFGPHRPPRADEARASPSTAPGS